jgi:hypothetical protein
MPLQTPTERASCVEILTHRRVEAAAQGRWLPASTGEMGGERDLGIQPTHRATEEGSG